MKAFNRNFITGVVLPLVLYVAAYTILFQAMYCWIKYDNPIGNWGTGVFLYSLPFNYFPMLFLAGIALFACHKTIGINRLWKKILLDALVILLAVVAVNMLFPIMTGLPVNWGGTLFNGIMIGIIIELWSVSRQKQEAIHRERIMEKEIEARKYEVIKAYVNPHFLYNTLDMLCALIEEKKQCEALGFALSLSSYYRHVTNLMNVRRSSLEEELKIVEDYINVVRHHYGDNISFHVKGDDDGSVTVVPFSIQLLVENALKHNVINDMNPMDISLDITEDGLSVSNSCKRKSAIDSRNNSGLGLKYLKSLYGYHGKSIEVCESPERFTVSLPKAI